MFKEIRASQLEYYQRFIKAISYSLWTEGVSFLKINRYQRL